MRLMSAAVVGSAMALVVEEQIYKILQNFQNSGRRHENGRLTEQCVMRYNVCWQEESPVVENCRIERNVEKKKRQEPNKIDGR